jgi:transposase
MKPNDPISQENLLSADQTDWPFPFPAEDWENTPESVRKYILFLHQRQMLMEKRVQEHEEKLNRNSSNSDRPPSSDNPYKKKKRKKKGRKGGAKKGHKGHKQVMLAPTKTVDLKPERCSCGNTHFPETEPYYTHQEIELPEIQMDVTHFILHEGFCPSCGKLNKAQVPKEHKTGYGPRMSSFIAETAGIQGNSRSTVQQFCSSVLGIPMSKGAVQKVIDRVSAAIKLHYEAIANVARKDQINHIDETPWYMNGGLMWMWVMVNRSVAYFMIHPKRSKEAFCALIEDWVGILVSDGYGVYRKWVNLRQTCLSHLIRKATSLSEKNHAEIASFGKRALAELQRLCHMAHDPPNVGQWRAFYARLSRLISENHDRKDEAGRFARRLLREMDSLWVFLEVKGVEPTNNRGERAIRFGVLWRKRSQGTASEKGNRWVERIISLKQTCSLRSVPTFPVLVDAMKAYFKEQEPDLAWIYQE